MADDSLISSCSSSDLTIIQTLLKTCSLPTGDLTEDHMRLFVCVQDQGNLFATGGLEIWEHLALLRSIATNPTQRGKGLATRVIMDLEKKAQESEVSDLYLITESAESYFYNLGYRVIPRSAAPANIAGTRQFTELCGDTATLMHKSLAITA